MFTCSECTLTYQGEPEYIADYGHVRACAQCAANMPRLEEERCRFRDVILNARASDVTAGPVATGPLSWTPPKEYIDRIKRLLLAENLAKKLK